MTELRRKYDSVPVIELPVERFELACGAKLIVSTRAGAPVTAVEVHMRGGPSMDPEGFEGTAFLTGGLLDQGTKQRDEQGIAELMEPAGGSISGDASGLHATIVSKEWKLLLAMIAELLVEPTFPKRQVDRQKDRLLHRLAVEREDPRVQGALGLRRLVYGNHWLGRPAYGTYDSVAKIEAKHLRAQHKRNWVGSRCLIAVSGDVEPQAVKRFLDRALRDWNPGRPLHPTPPELPARGVRTALFKAERQQVHVHLGHLGIKRADPDYAALVVLDHVLGMGPGFTNRLSRILRDEQGLAYTVSASISSSAGLMPGVFNAYIGCAPEKVGTAVAGFLTEMRRLQTELVPADELEVARNYLLGSFPREFERASRRAGYLVTAEVFGLSDDNLRELPRAFAAVTPEEVQRVARQHLHPDACCLSVSGPMKATDVKKLLGRAR